LFIFEIYFFAGIILFVFYHPLKNKRKGRGRIA